MSIPPAFVLELSCAPLTAVEDAGATVFTLTATEAGGKGFDRNSVPKFGGVLPEATVTWINPSTLSVELDVATLALGDSGVTVIDGLTGSRIADGVTVTITEAE